MPVADVYTARSGAFSTGTIITAQPFLTLQPATTKRAYVVGVRVDVGATLAAAGNWLLFQLSRPGNTATATGLAVVTNGNDFNAPASITQFATTWSTAPTVSATAGGIVWEQALPMTTGSSWEEFPPAGYEWQIPAIATGSANAGLHMFVTQSVGTTTPVYCDLIFSE